MDIKLINTVILAEDYETLVEFYSNALELDVKLKHEGEYHYTDLSKDGQLIVGIAPASEMHHTPTSPRNNSAVLQISTDDINELFSRVKEFGATALFGPSVDKNEGFTYGAFADPEGNHVWVMENFDFS